MYHRVGKFARFILLVLRDLTEFAKVYPTNLLISQSKRIIPVHKLVSKSDTLLEVVMMPIAQHVAYRFLGAVAGSPYVYCFHFNFRYVTLI